MPGEQQNDPRSECDVVVIGGGIGGLAAASFLAQAGLEVQLLEARPTLGGYLAGFERGGFRFDTAIHWLNFFGHNGITRHLLQFLGGVFPPTPAPRVIRRYRSGDSDYRLTPEPLELREALIRDFPSEQRGITTFFDDARAVGVAFAELGARMASAQTMSLWTKLTQGTRLGITSRPLWRLSGKPADPGLERYFRASGISRLFCAEEFLVSCLMPIGWAFTDNYHLPPAGGSRAIVDFLARALESHGGSCRLGARVSRVLVKNRTATGVRFKAKDNRQGEVRSRYVVCSSDLFDLVEALLPPGSISDAYKKKLNTADIYDSAVTVSVGLDRPAEQLGFDDGLALISDPGHTRKEYRSGDPKKSVISVLAPSVFDPSLSPTGKGTLTLFTHANIRYDDTWKTGPGFERGDAYYENKQQYAEILLERVEKALSPSLRRHVTLVDTATPITYRRYTSNRNGTIMGQRPTRRNVLARLSGYRTPVKNLYLGGQWAELGGGVPATVRAAANSAALILKRENPDAFKALIEALNNR